ncbi:MAG: hypothetical protein BM564_07205 [Bacteroidetes bacterium MedPE-SWsnd-G2]|nr:MAG: hypothetical protein BM564_07205 [Bacteroidetes bacterium MedPE-SWsnd-G2]
MTDWKFFKSNKAVLTVCSVLIIVLFIGVFLENSALISVSKLAVIPAFVGLYFIRRSYMPNFFFLILLCLFFAELFNTFSSNHGLLNLSRAFNLTGFVLLLSILMSKLKSIKFEGVVTVYLLVVFIINGYFVYSLFDSVKGEITNNLDMVYFLGKGGLSLFLGLISFAVYLSRETTRSIIFLVMTLAFLFSDVLNFICNYYLYYSGFEFVGGVLKIAALFFLMRYIYTHRSTNVRQKKEQSVLLNRSANSGEIKMQIN